MALNLKPGQILQSSIYQPMRTHHYTDERALPAYPPDQYIHPSHAPTEVDYDAVSVGPPLRRNQTLPVTSSAQGPLEQSHQIPHHMRSEDQTDPVYKRPYPVDPSIYQPQPPPPNSAHQHQLPRYTSETPSNPMPSHSSHRTRSDHAARHRSSHIDPVHNIQPSSEPVSTTSVFPPEAPPTPDLDLRLSRTLYLTNPDEIQYPSSHRSRALPLPSAPEVIYPSPEPHPEQSSRSRANSSYGGQPPRGSPPTETSRRSSPRGSPPASSTAPRQEKPRQEKARRYEPPSQNLAAMGVPVPGHSASVTSGSSSRTSSSLAPRHVPKHLVMPTPLAATAETPRRPPLSSRANSDGDPRRPSQLLRRRSIPGAVPPRQSPSKPPQTVSRGVLSFFGFGKGSKPTVHVRVTEPPKNVMSEKQQLRVRAHQEPRKLSKRK